MLEFFGVCLFFTLNKHKDKNLATLATHIIKKNIIQLDLRPPKKYQISS